MVSTVTMHTCEFCGAEWRSPISAALCCDVVSNTLHDERMDKPDRYERGYD